ncbi:flagellar basal body P-ring formation chaperone FlgA [Stieleria marina]
MRILIDGYPRTQFSVSGPEAVLVSCGKTTRLAPRLETELANEIERQFALGVGDVTVRLANEQQTKAVQDKLKHGDYQTTVLLSDQLPMGQTSVEVEFAPNHGPHFVERFDAKIIVSIRVALAKQPIERGVVLDSSMFNLVQRPIVRKADFARDGYLVGRVAKRNIASNEVILSSYLAERTHSREPIIKRNDLLDVIVPLGRNEIRLKNAKSLSTGDVGDTITVINTRSNRQLSAIVVDRNLARVLPITGKVRR